MASTPSFNWSTPDNTGLVKNGALDIRTLGNAIDTSMTDLLGGTTGQVLKKNSNTDMDFVWSSDSAGMTNPMTTTGDTIYSSSGSTPARLGIGSTGQVLTVSGGVPTWASPAGGGKVLQVINATTSTQTLTSTNTYIDTTLTATITPTSATSKILVIVFQNGVLKTAANSANSVNIKLLRGATDIVAPMEVNGGFTGTAIDNCIGTVGTTFLDNPATTSATTYKTQFRSQNNSAAVYVQNNSAISTITLMEIGA